MLREGGRVRLRSCQMQVSYTYIRQLRIAIPSNPRPPPNRFQGNRPLVFSQVWMETRTPDFSPVRFHAPKIVVSNSPESSEGAVSGNDFVSRFVSVRFLFLTHRKETRNEAHTGSSSS